MAKTKDLFLNMVANPNMTLADLASVGITSENTMLLDRASYASNEKVQNLFKDAEGNFDEAKFNTWYDLAEQNYNILATDEANINLMDVTAYDVDNIFVDPSKRTRVNAPVVVKLPNPDRLNVGLTRIGKVGPRILSQDEIAQTQEVLLNPVEVSKGAKPIYGKAPNDSWFEDFWDTKVMAAWDEDGTHIDPITGVEVQHQKGDLKLNEYGTYYYESLDGRSVYGKRVLNKFNTLTTDGSAWNKYDFFDSDDIEQKSVGGSVMKNLALVGSMFIPYVGWGIAAASVVHQMAGLTATFGKMLAGSDSPSLNALEGWVKSTDRRNLKTEYAQQNMWCWENFIDLIGDTTAQLREQRAIFKFAPGIIKGDFKALDEKAMAKHTEKMIKESMENLTDKSFNDLTRLAYKQNPVHWKEQFANLRAGAKDIITTKAEKAARDYVTNYYKLGEPIARAYMTAITVQDTFGEAIQAGATDTEATLLTLGYAAAEAALLSTDLGKWIMPELRMEKQRAKTIAKRLLEEAPEVREMSRNLSRLDGESKKTWAKRLFNVGKDIFKAEYSTAKKTVGSVLAQGLGEGIEEVSEEALADFSKSCFNVVQKLQGDDVRLNAFNHNWSWSEAANRYGMSFAGGIIGGGINAAASDFKGFRDLDNMTSKQAMQQLVYMVRNNEMDDFWKVIDKTQLASKELGTKFSDDGLSYKPGTKEDNQDLEAHRFLRKQVSLIESILNAENGTLDDSGLLSTLIKADPALKDLDPVKEYRMRALANSATAGRFLNEYNTKKAEIANIRMKQLQIIDKYGDASSEKYSDEDKKALKGHEQDLKRLRGEVDAMLDGGRTREYVRDALFEMSYAVKDPWDTWATEVRYAETITGKKYKDISEEQKQKLKEQYEALKSSNEYAEQIHNLAEMYEALATSASNSIQESAKYYDGIKQSQYDNLSRFNRIVARRLIDLQNLTLSKDASISNIQKFLGDDYNEEFFDVIGSNEFRKEWYAKADDFRTKKALLESGSLDVNAAAIIKDQIADYEVDFRNMLIDTIWDKINSTYDEAINVGFLHPESRILLDNLLNTLQSHTDYLSEYGDISREQEYRDKLQELVEKGKKIRELPNTPIIDNLSKFQLSTNVDKSVLDLVISLIDQEESDKNQISDFQLNKDTIDLFAPARTFLELYRSTIVGARYDNVDLDHIVGFNTTLNELSGSKEKPNLAEIDAQTADLILQDINMALARLDYAEGLHNLNTGNKYNVQNKASLNKQFIMYNRIDQFVSTIQDDDDWKDKDGDTSLADLKTILNSSKTLKEKTGIKNSERKFALSPDEKLKIEKESIELQAVLHKFLNSRIDGSEASVKKLAKLFTYDRYKGLIRQNDDFLNQDSDDIDDSAFIWWLCATAALDPNQFYNNYRHIIGEEAEGEKPIAPLATQELGIYALTAAVVNGDMFRTFGKALRESLLNTWNDKPETREQIRKDYGSKLLEDDFLDWFKNADFLPNFDNIVFIEGISGSGKSTGVLKSWSKLLAKVNSEFVSKKMLIAHTSKAKADVLGKSSSFTNYEAHDHDSLLSWMSLDYKNMQDDTGKSTYILDRDVKLVDGVLRSNWKLRVIDKSEVPSVIVIDEWSHYNQVEQELVQRFAQTYGITVVTMGDYDQLTPSAEVKKNESDKDALMLLNPHRNMTVRTVKLGVSMRTDNEIKDGDMYSMLAWKKNPIDAAVQLHYYEDNSGLYGDKVYNIDNSYGAAFDKVKADVDLMIKTLKEGESIGYIYHSKDSELYKWLTTTEGVKDKINPFSEKDAHGREAQYYIVENNRETEQDTEDYFSSVYTGMTRAEQGSIIIAPTSKVRKAFDDKYNRAGLLLTSTKDAEVKPNAFTDAGTRDFSKRRKEIFDKIFTDEPTPFNIKPRTLDPVDINRGTRTDPSPELGNPKPQEPTDPTIPQQQTQQQSNSDELPPPTNIPTEVYERVDLTQLPAEREETPSTEEELPPPTDIPQESYDRAAGVTTWQGPLKRNQMLYSRAGIGSLIIRGEDLSDSTKPKYIIEELISEQEMLVDKDVIHNNYFLKLPKTDKLAQEGQQFISKKGNVVTVDKVSLEGDPENPTWVYNIAGENINHQKMSEWLANNSLTPYINPENVPTEVPETVYNVGSVEESQALINEQFADPQIQSIQMDGDDIKFDLFGFTFNTSYSGDNFDKNGKLIMDENGRDDLRIDNGYGLRAIDPTMFSYKKDIETALGSIRQHLRFSSNTDILHHIRQVLGEEVCPPNLSIQWAFISKAPGGARQDMYGRYNSSLASLDYMFGENIPMSNKTISAVIYSNGNPILELPVLTLQSPHSIFNEMREKEICSDITKLWKFGAKDVGETYTCIQNIISLINSKYSDPVKYPGYQNLGKLLQLWLFTSNGFKVIKNNDDPSRAWNLHEFCKNRGNLYITKRYSDDYKYMDFEGSWVDLNLAQRPDRFISSIFMNNSDEFADNASETPINIFRKYTPYVLISDSPKIDNDVAAINQYLKQQADPKEEKLVKAVPVMSPEVSVSNYIRAMAELFYNDTKTPYGNTFSAFRIWEAILASPYASEILKVLDAETDRKFVIDTVSKLAAIAQKQQNVGESNLVYKKRIAEEQKAVLQTFDDSNVQVLQKLRKLLIQTYKYKTLDGSLVDNEERLSLIQKACDDYKMTGIMCHPAFSGDNNASPIGGTIYKIKVDVSDKYKFPQGGYFRIFGKIDTPTYYLDSLFDHISEWADDAKHGLEYYDKKRNKNVVADVWYFKSDDAENYYLPRKNGSKLNLTNVLKKGKVLLDKLGIKDYNIDTNALGNFASESDAINALTEMINQRFIEDRGAFIIKDSRGNYQYGNIISEQTPEFADYKFRQGYIIDGKYQLEFTNLATNNIEMIEIELDPVSNQFSIMPKVIPAEPVSLNISEMKSKIQEEMDIIEQLGDEKWLNILKDAYECYDEETNTIDVEKVEKILEESGYDDMSITMLRDSLQLNSLDQNRNEDVCVNPIKIAFK